MRRWLLLAAVAVPAVGFAQSYGCTQDCSGHDAGYQWAEQQGITDPSECGGNSQSFIEGCEVYASEQQNQEQQQMIEDGECEDSDEDGLCD